MCLCSALTNAMHLYQVPGSEQLSCEGRRPGWSRRSARAARRVISVSRLRHPAQPWRHRQRQRRRRSQSECVRRLSVQHASQLPGGAAACRCRWRHRCAVWWWWRRGGHWQCHWWRSTSPQWAVLLHEITTQVAQSWVVPGKRSAHRRRRGISDTLDGGFVLLNK